MAGHSPSKAGLEILMSRPSTSTTKPPKTGMPGSINKCSSLRKADCYLVGCDDAKSERLLLGVCRHVSLEDLVGIAHGLAALDLVDVLHALGDRAPDRVLAVKETCIIEANEELAI